MRVSGIKHGIAHLSDAQGSTTITGDRGQEIDAIQGDETKKGLKVNPIADCAHLRSCDGANETKVNPRD